MVEATEIPPSSFKSSVKIITDIVSINEQSCTTSNGHSFDIDSIIFATGFLYNYPFLDSHEFEYPITVNGRNVQNLYLHLFRSDVPSLSFVGLPRDVVPFMLAEYQAELIAAVYSGRLILPDVENMLENERMGGIGACADAKFDSKHYFGFTGEMRYCNHLAALIGIEDVDDWRVDLRRNCKELRYHHLFGDKI
jgi:hypothetical protein